MYPYRDIQPIDAAGPFPNAQAADKLAGQDREPLGTARPARAAAGRGR